MQTFFLNRQTAGPRQLMLNLYLVIHAAPWLHDAVDMVCRVRSGQKTCCNPFTMVGTSCCHAIACCTFRVREFKSEVWLEQCKGSVWTLRPMKVSLLNKTSQWLMLFSSCLDFLCISHHQGGAHSIGQLLIKIRVPGFSLEYSTNGIPSKVRLIGGLSERTGNVYARNPITKRLGPVCDKFWTKMR